MTRTAISPRLAMRTLVSTPYGYLRAGRTCQISPRRRSRRALRRRALGRRDRLHQRRRHGAGPPGRARGDRAGRRPPDRRPGPGRAHVDGAARARACCCRSCCARPRRSSTWRRWPSRSSAAAAVDVGGRVRAPAEVAERPRVARRRLGARPQAGRHPRRGRLAGRRRRSPAGGRSRRRTTGPSSWSASASTWRGPPTLPDELADIAVAINHVVDDARRSRGPADRAARGARPALRRRSWRATARRCSTSGAPGRPRSAGAVRVDLGADDVEGTAVDVTDDGHLVVETLEGSRRDVRRRRRRPPPLTSVAAWSGSSGCDEAHRLRSSTRGARAHEPSPPRQKRSPRRGGRHAGGSPPSSEGSYRDEEGDVEARVLARLDVVVELGRDRLRAVRRDRRRRSVGSVSASEPDLAGFDLEEAPRPCGDAMGAAKRGGHGRRVPGRGRARRPKAFR